MLRPRFRLVLAAAYVLAYPLAGHPPDQMQQNIPPSLRLSEKIKNHHSLLLQPAPSHSTTVIASEQVDLLPSVIHSCATSNPQHRNKPHQRTLLCSSALLLQMNLTCTNLLALTRRSCTASMYLVFNRLPVLSRSIRRGVRC